MATALITGASTGIGFELAKVFAANNINLVLVARSEDKLNQLAATLSLKNIQVKVIVADLSKMDSVEKVYHICKSENIVIDYLVNNAGFGDYGFFNERDWNKQAGMIDLNIKSLTLFCHLFLQDMIARGTGKIMNVASTASFQPGPTMAVYYASKAYVLHFTEAIANEVENKNITVTALCPGATTSDFQRVAEMDESKLVKGKKLPTSKEVAEYGYSAMMKGKRVAVHGLLNYWMSQGYRFLPRNLMVKVVRFIQDKVH